MLGWGEDVKWDDVFGCDGCGDGTVDCSGIS
jgi:hypothetical protein